MERLVFLTAAYSIIHMTSLANDLSPQTFQTIGDFNCNWQLCTFTQTSITNSAKTPLNFSSNTLSQYIRKLVWDTKWHFRSQVTCHLHGVNDGGIIKIIYIGSRLNYHVPQISPQRKYVRILNPNVDKESIHRAQLMRPRDFNNLANASVFLCIGKIAQEIFQLHNKTGITWDTPLPAEIEGFPVPSILPNAFASALGTLNRNLVNPKSSYHFRLMDIPYNFAYCATKDLEDFSLQRISALLSPFSKMVWISVAALLVILPVIFIVLNHKLTFSDYFSIMSTLSFNLLATSIKDKKVEARFLHVLWLHVCVILSNLYTGTITSVLIKPYDEETLRSVQDLVAHNYTTIFPMHLPAQLTAIAGAIKMFENSTERISPDIHWVRKLIGENPEKRHLLGNEFMETLAFQSGISVLTPWPYAILSRNKAQNLIDQRKKYSSKAKEHFHKDNVSERRCHIGKKLVVISSPAILWSFFPPFTEELYGTLEILAQNGIFFFWMRKFFGMTYADRIQDQQKVLNRTKITEDENGFQPMSFEHASSTIIFLLWSLLIMFTLIWFLLGEFFYTKIKLRHQKQSRLK